MPETPRAVLWTRGGPKDGQTIGLVQNVTMIGRDSTCEVVVDEPGVSRINAGIRKNQDVYWIQDMESRNGTFVNGEEVEGEGRRLANMDRIQLGGAQSVYWVFKEVESTVTLTRPTHP